MTSLKDIRVLIVDDEPDILSTISEEFQIFGFQTDTAPSGKQAWDKLKNDKFDIVVTDVRMNNGSGLDLIRKIKERDVNSPKVFFVSGYTDMTLAEIYHNGADGFFPKPFEASQLRLSLQKAATPPGLFLSHKPTIDPDIYIEKSIDNFISAAESDNIVCGRGGFFWSGDFNIEDETNVSFQISVSDKLPSPIIRGVAKVQWSRHENPANLPSGLGLEIVYLEDDCREAVVNWLGSQNFVPYIPMT